MSKRNKKSNKNKRTQASPTGQAFFVIPDGYVLVHALAHDETCDGAGECLGWW